MASILRKHLNKIIPNYTQIRSVLFSSNLGNAPFGDRNLIILEPSEYEPASLKLESERDMPAKLKFETED